MARSATKTKTASKRAKTKTTKTKSTKKTTIKPTVRKSYYKRKTPVVIKTEVLPEAVTRTKPSTNTLVAIPKKPASTRSTGNYLSKSELMKAVMESKGLGRMSNDLAFKLKLLTTKYAKSAQFARYCVDTETEALTKRGWLTYEDITTEDEILSYNINTKQLTWSKIIDLYIDRYEGKMHRLTTRGMDALVTPDHKFVSQEHGIKRVEDIISNEHIVLMGDPVTIEQQNSCTLTDAEVQTIGWAVTEGHYVKGSKTKHAVDIFQKVGQNADKIRECLSNSNVHFIEYMNKPDLIAFHCTGPFISSVYTTLAPNRVLSMDLITSLTESQREILIETMIAGDGWYRPNHTMSYVQKDKKHVDAFLALCTLSGYLSYTTKRIYKTPASKIHPHGSTSLVHTVNLYQKTKRVCKAEHIDFHGGKQTAGGRREQKPNIPTQDYTGVIWCPQTEYGTFVCRRGGYVYVTGNTFNDDMQGYALMMLVRTWNSFNPLKSDNPFAFYTQCIKNSFVQYLNQEKKQRNIKDELLVDQGLLPSYTYQLEYEDGQQHDREQRRIERELPDPDEEELVTVPY